MYIIFIIWNCGVGLWIRGFDFLGDYEDVLNQIYIINFFDLVFEIIFFYMGVDFDQFWFYGGYFYFYIEDVIDKFYFGIVLVGSSDELFNFVVW